LNDIQKNEVARPLKMQKVVPNLISWLSEKQPVYSASNAIPKVKQI